jgi:hypothetical protein
MFFLFGANRFSALLPNFIYFIILQAITLYTIRHFSKKTYLSLFVLGVMLAALSPTSLIGGMYDFRMDFIAFCLMGIWVACVIRSQLFLDRRWSYVVGFCAILMILNRAITLTYLIGIMSIMSVYLFAASKIKKDSLARSRYHSRFIHSALVLACIIGLSLSYVYLNWSELYHYYVVGHVINNEKYIRVVEAGIESNFRMWIFYPYTLLGHQIGPYACVMIIAWLSTLLFPYLRLSHHQRVPIRHTSISHKIDDWWIDGSLFLCLCAAIPLVILTLDISKSGVVGAIAIMPSLWLVIWLTLLLDNHTPSRLQLRFLQCITVLTLALGITNQFKKFPTYERPSNQQDLMTITKMHQDIADYAAKQGWDTIILSSDRIRDYLQPTTIPVLYYEYYGKLISSRSTAVGTGIFSASQPAMLNAMKTSNAVIFNVSNNYPEESPYPADLSIAKFKPTLINIAKTEFKALGDYSIQNTTYRVYVKEKEREKTTA